MILALSPKLAARRSLWLDRASFFKSEYSRQLRKHRSWPLPARARPVSVRPARLNHPLRARLGTSDFPVIADLLGAGAADGRGEYDAAMEAAETVCSGAHNVRLVLDLGANIGVAAAMFEHRFLNASIIAVEPDTANFALLESNVSRPLTSHPSNPTIPRRACVAATHRTVALDRTGHGGEPWAIAMVDAPAPSADLVETLTITDLLNHHAASRVQRIDLLKCDIEGAERELFGACADWIDRITVAVVELHAPYRELEFLDDIRRASNGRLSFAAKVLRRQGPIEVILLTRQESAA